MNNELRPGNLVMRTNGQFMTVKRVELDSPDILVKEFEGLFTFGYTALPIPINEEVLRLFGFEKDDVFAHYICKISAERIIGLTYSKVDKAHGIHLGQSANGKYFRDVYISQVMYLHELQNLFFSLTKQELKQKYNMGIDPISE